ncbi:hypothetical protein MKX01_017706, partial [Papaver californicum]
RPIKRWDLGIKTMKNATLQFDIELLSWSSVKDICKDGGFVKKVLTEGEKWENPKDLDEVLGRECSFIVEFVVGDEVIDGLDRAIMTMKTGEVALVTIEPEYSDKYAKASKRYEKAARFIDSPFSEEEKKQDKTLKVICSFNNAACKLKLKSYKEAENMCTKLYHILSCCAEHARLLLFCSVLEIENQNGRHFTNNSSRNSNDLQL